MTQQRRAQKIHDLSIDEVSLVDKGANQHAVVTIAKSAGGEKEKEMEIFDEQGNQLDVASLSVGDTVFDASGEEYVLDYEDEAEGDAPDYSQFEEQYDPEPVGKSASFPRANTITSGDNLLQDIQKSLSNAKTDRERDEIIAKALGAVGSLSHQVEIAKAATAQERSLRLEREYTEIAKSYNLPVEDDVLGGVLMRCAENLSVEDCEIISKCMEAAGQAMYEEIGYVGGGDNADVMAQLEAEVDGIVSKSNGFSREEVMAEAFSNNPDLYDEYLNDHRAR